MKFDGDSALLSFFIVVGVIPVAGDVAQGRRIGGLTTAAMLVVVVSALALSRRTVLLLKARALRRQLLARECRRP